MCFTDKKKAPYSLECLIVQGFHVLLMLLGLLLPFLSCSGYCFHPERYRSSRLLRKDCRLLLRLDGGFRQWMNGYFLTFGDTRKSNIMAAAQCPIMILPFPPNVLMISSMVTLYGLSAFC